MIWINKIILENFQSHKYTELEFVKGLNAIIGSTDSGKTAIFRALKWALYNEPQGDYFVREGEDYVSVIVFFSTGFIVNRYRNKNRNGYELTYPDGNVLVFEGFGVKVPDEIIEATKIRKINFTPSENSSLNMAEQLDAPFLISERPSLKAAAIGKLVEADVVDYALYETNLDLKNKKRDLKSSKESLDSIRESLKDYEYLDSLKLSIEKLEEIQRNKEKLQARLQNLERIRDNYFFILDRKNKYEKQISELKSVEKLENIFLELEVKNSNIKNLNRIFLNLSANRNNSAILYKTIGNLHQIEKSDDLIPKIELNNNLLSKLQSVSNRLKAMKNHKDYYTQISKNLNVLDRISSLETKLLNSNRLYTSLANYQKNLNTLKSRIGNGDLYIQEFTNVTAAEEIFKNLDIKKEKLKTLEKNYKELKDIILDLKREEIKIKTLIESIEENIKNYNIYLKEVKRCPTCFKPIEDEDVESIISYLIE